MNKVILAGNIATDIETGTTQSGITRATFRVAVSRRYTKDGKRESDFFSCVAWRQTAEFIARYFAKGNRIMIEGNLQNRSYDAQDGSKRYVTEVIADNVEFCDKADNNAQQGFTPAAGETARQAEAMFGQRPDFISDDELPF